MQPSARPPATAPQTDLHGRVQELQKQLTGSTRPHPYLGKLFRALRTLKLRSSLHSGAVVVGSVAEDSSLQVLEVRGRRGNVVCGNLIGWANLFDARRDDCYVEPRIALAGEQFLFSEGEQQAGGEGGEQVAVGEASSPGGGLWGWFGGGKAEKPAQEGPAEQDAYNFLSAAEPADRDGGAASDVLTTLAASKASLSPLEKQQAIANFHKQQQKTAFAPSGPDNRGHPFLGASLADHLENADDAVKLSLLMQRSLRIGAGTVAISTAVYRILSRSWLRVFALAWARLKQRVAWSRAFEEVATGKRTEIMEIVTKLREGHLSSGGGEQGGAGPSGGSTEGGDSRKQVTQDMQEKNAWESRKIEAALEHYKPKDQKCEKPAGTADTSRFPQERTSGGLLAHARAGAYQPGSFGAQKHPNDPLLRSGGGGDPLAPISPNTLPPHLLPHAVPPGLLPHDTNLREYDYELWRLESARRDRLTVSDAAGWDLARRRREQDAAAYRILQAGTFVQREMDMMYRDVGLGVVCWFVFEPLLDIPRAHFAATAGDRYELN